jgi:cyclophilin family peptidyl-prolyl cis-trans isomerase
MKTVLTALLSGLVAFSVQAKTTVVEMKTSLGVVTIELADDAAPNTVANFVKYAEAGFFEGTIFHRVIPGFMAQGGGFDSKMVEKKTLFAPIKNEAEAASKGGMSNTRGTLAMARTRDPHVKDNAFLNFPGQDGWGYAVFGKVTAGMDIVDKMVAVESANAGPHANVPKTPIIIEKVTLKR